MSWFQLELEWLAIVGLGVVVATPIIEENVVLIQRLVPQVQIAIGSIISIGFTVA